MGLKFIWIEIKLNEPEQNISKKYKVHRSPSKFEFPPKPYCILINTYSPCLFNYIY